MSENGWIKLYKKMLESPTLHGDITAQGIWLYLLINASHLEYQTKLNGETVTVRNGQVVTSATEISEYYKIDCRTVRRVLERFESDGMIERGVSVCSSVSCPFDVRLGVRLRGHSKYIVNIVNFAQYQGGTVRLQSNNVSVSCPSDCPSDAVSSSYYNKNNNKTDKNIPPYPPQGAEQEREKPSEEEVKEYAATVDKTADATAFYDYYTAIGWTAGGSPIRDWKALFRAWIKKQKSGQNYKAPPQEEWMQHSSFDADEFFEAACNRKVEW